MTSLSDLLGMGKGGSDPSPRVVNAMDRIAEAVELSAAIRLRESLKDPSGATAERLGKIISKLGARLARRHEGGAS